MRNVCKACVKQRRQLAEKEGWVRSNENGLEYLVRIQEISRAFSNTLLAGTGIETKKDVLVELQVGWNGVKLSGLWWQTGTDPFWFWEWCAPPGSTSWFQNHGTICGQAWVEGNVFKLVLCGRTCVINIECFPVWLGHKSGSVQLSIDGWCQVWSGILETWIRNHSPGNVCICRPGTPRDSFTSWWRGGTNP